MLYAEGSDHEAKTTAQEPEYQVDHPNGNIGTYVQAAKNKGQSDKEPEVRNAFIYRSR
jgi:hypothetical protein